MPANEEILSAPLQQSLDNFLGKACVNGCVSSNDDEDDCQKCCLGSNFKQNGKEECQYKSFPVREVHEKFMRSFIDLLLEDAVFKGTARKNRVVEWMEPSALHSAIDLNLQDQGVSHEELFSLARNVIKYSVKTGHPRFVNQLYSSVDPYGLLGQWLTDALNPSVYTYEVSPVFSLMEEEILREMRKIVGWKDGRGEGIFCPGGSIANGYAINLARHYRFPQLKELGMTSAGRLIVFTSQDAHYSVKKLSAFLGIGTSNVCEVKTDNKGKMCMVDLEAQIKRVLEDGATPLMVSATAGTTVLGAYDPLRDTAAICKKYNMWFHVDAAWGGGALMSKKYRHLLDGAELADSITWNPHKLLAAPQQCSTLLLRHEGLLQAAHGLKASYLFQPDKFYDTSFDSGDKHMQCGRKADVLKFWFMWKAKGTRGLEKHVDRVFELSRYFTDYIRHREGFKLMLEPECTNVCFWYVPPSKRHLQGEELSKVFQKIGPAVKERMVKKGSMLITYQPQRELPNFFRLVLQNSGLTEADMRFFAEEIERLASDL
ncbi:Glutamate decarboxylase-like protein 1 [Habropoda laboriosa]|uniref:Glutamate decarboxylase-like protein 1 n=1 Tax=Habropoda laboriosa TaxID=597456 RepID=A0A0L7RAZ6_9HYME|nr:PREDICTED: cysteine sulfinic acid decarboxylase [Habropoda laboriosa]KOC67911.1 Glutamate decarboxylase-like protein 1 [Habropoda laboriosa]